MAILEAEIEAMREQLAQLKAQVAVTRELIAAFAHLPPDTDTSHADGGYPCPLCGAFGWDDTHSEHTPTCLISRTRASLAAQQHAGMADNQDT
jgi:hypothetical protein